MVRPPITQTNPTSSLGPYTEDRDLGGDIGEGPVTNDFATTALHHEHTQHSSKLHTSPVAASTCARAAADLSHLTLGVHNLSETSTR